MIPVWVWEVTFLIECSTPVHFQVTQEAVSFEWSPEQEKALSHDQAKSMVLEVSVACRDHVGDFGRPPRGISVKTQDFGANSCHFLWVTTLFEKKLLVASKT